MRLRPNLRKIGSLFAAEAIAPGLPGFTDERAGMSPGHLAEIFEASGRPLYALN